MDSDLQPVYDRVMNASRPEDLFDELRMVLPARLMEEHLKSEIAALRAVVDNSKYEQYDDQEAAKLASDKLESLYIEAIRKSDAGLYNLNDYKMVPVTGNTKVITVKDNRFVIGPKRHIGTHSTIYDGRVEIDEGTGAVMFRVANTPEDNPYLFKEIQVLDRLHQKDVGYWRSLPHSFGQFNTGERVGIVYRKFDGYTLEEIRSYILHKDGLDQRHMIWILDRLLSLLGYVHSRGVVHCHISPASVRVRPSNHNILLTGWSGSVSKPAITGERTHTSNSVFEAPEISVSGRIGPWTDIYAAGKTMIWILGGDPVTNEIPNNVEPKIRKFLCNMVRESINARPHDAWQLYKAQNRLKDSLWTRQFRHLEMEKGD